MEYESTQFFSDIGGAAGLILGVSLNAFFGIAGKLQFASSETTYKITGNIQKV